MMDKMLIIVMLVSFGISAVLGPVLIPVLRRLKAGQTVRDDGPDSHLVKNGTPTMGGVIFLFSFLPVCLIFGAKEPSVIAVLIATFGFALIGFIDDYIKVVLKRSMGLRAWQKFSLQIVLAIAVLIYLDRVAGMNFALRIPFTQMSFGMGWIAYPLLVFVMVGTVNGANFTDGLDGLASKVTAVIAAFLLVAAVLLGDGSKISSAAMIGALLGFLLYNAHKASVFMGDTGSLALGGFVAITAICMNLTLYIVLIAFIYLAEVCSVILQVGYFKLTHGKRIFRMAPIHHHFELGGWKETKVVAVFTIVTIVLCLVSLLGI